MVMLARHRDGRLWNAEIAETLHASEHTLAKVLQHLGKIGLVASTRGPRGGFVLGKPASEITLLEIYTAVEGPPGKATCLFSRRVCRGESCVLDGLLRVAEQQVGDYLAGTYLDEIARRVEMPNWQRSHSGRRAVPR